MIERLNQLSLAKFIDLLCGDNSVLLVSGDNTSDDELKERSSKFIIEYKTIVNPSGMKASIIDREDMIKINTKILLLRICQTLIALNCHDDVRDVLSLNLMANEQIGIKVERLLSEALFEQKRSNEIRSGEKKDEKPAPEQIRSSFDAEIAFMMTYFKMNIDVNITNAAVYANIVHQADMDIRMKLTKNP